MSSPHQSLATFKCLRCKPNLRAFSENFEGARFWIWCLNLCDKTCSWSALPDLWFGNYFLQCKLCRVLFPMLNPILATSSVVCLSPPKLTARADCRFVGSDFIGCLRTSCPSWIGVDSLDSRELVVTFTQASSINQILSAFEQIGRKDSKKNDFSGFNGHKCCVP